MEDNKNPKGAAPKAPPCCLPFGKDFLCFGLISGAHPEAFPPSFFGTVHLPWFSQGSYCAIKNGGPPRGPLIKMLCFLIEETILSDARLLHTKFREPPGGASPPPHPP